MKVYTKTGDSGDTSLYDGSRAPKYAINFEALGEMDELSSRIGMLCILIEETNNNQNSLFKSIIEFLRKIQRTLQDFNSHIATIDQENRKLPALEENLVVEIEVLIDKMEMVNPKLTKFILPGRNKDDSQAHLCRTQTRKAERVLNNLHSTNELLTVTRGNERTHVELEKFTVPVLILKYMNRLSDFFFVLGRWLCSIKGQTDCFY